MNAFAIAAQRLRRRYCRREETKEISTTSRQTRRTRKAKVLVEHGWLDPLNPPEKVVAFAQEMTARGSDWQLHVHGRAMHAFTVPEAKNLEYGMACDANADRRSWASTTAFLLDLFNEA